MAPTRLCLFQNYTVPNNVLYQYNSQFRVQYCFKVVFCTHCFTYSFSIKSLTLLYPRILSSRSQNSEAQDMNSVAVILHCDLDCFYAQVERERLGLPKDAEIAVVQWSSALAVSYPARKYGIKRGSTVEDIRRLSDNAVTIVHVDTISSTGSENVGVKMERTVQNMESMDARTTEKVSLARYREASAQVLATLREVLAGTGAVIERASIDEAYIDVTAEVQRRLGSCLIPPDLSIDTCVVGGALDTTVESNTRLMHGAAIASKIRQRVSERCGYTMSAGVSVNKLIAKFASAANKPNQQTVVPVCAITGLLRDLPLTKLRGLGGKLGRDVEALGVHTAGDAVSLPIERLHKALRSRKSAEFVYKCVRGIDESKVVARDMAKSLLAAKSFDPERDLNAVETTWIPLLADELTSRLDYDIQTNERDASTLTISFRAISTKNNDYVSASRSTEIPHGHGKARKAEIVKTAIATIRTVVLKDNQYRLPISFIGLTATNFVQRANERERISHFFTAKAEADPDAKIDAEVKVQQKLDTKAEYEKRVQEKADRELALRMHREESLGGVRKPVKKLMTDSSGRLQGKRRNVTRGKSSRPQGVAAVDSFFKKGS